MYTVIKRMEVSAAHSLKLSYRSKCENLHGHNWIITVYCRSKELNADGMVVDFSHIKQVVKEQLDHLNLKCSFDLSYNYVFQSPTRIITHHHSSSHPNPRPHNNSS